MNDDDLIAKLREKHPSLVTQSMIMDEAAARIEKLLLEISLLKKKSTEGMNGDDTVDGSIRW